MDILDATMEENTEMQKELMRIARKSKLKRKLVSIAVLIVVVLLAIAVAWLTGRSQAKKKTEQEIADLKVIIREKEAEIQELNENPIVVSPIAPEISLDILHSKISEIAELATMEYLFTDSAKFTDSKQIEKWKVNIPFTQKSFIMKWDGVIKAGVNLDQVSIIVSKEEKKIIVTIPKAEILSYEIDNDSVQVLDEKNNIFNPISVEDKVKFDSKTENAMKERAIENGLLEKAQINAENILARLILSDPEVAAYYAIEFTVNN